LLDEDDIAPDFQEEVPHTATHCNTLQHTATHCSTLQHTADYLLDEDDIAPDFQEEVPHAAAYCSILQHTATHIYGGTYMGLQHPATQSTTHCNTLLTIF